MSVKLHFFLLKKVYNLSAIKRGKIGHSHNPPKAEPSSHRGNNLFQGVWVSSLDSTWAAFHRLTSRSQPALFNCDWDTSISETSKVHHCNWVLLRNSSSAAHLEALAAHYDPSYLKTNFTWGTLSVTNSDFVQSCISMLGGVA